MEVHAIEVIARLLGRNRELGATEQLADLISCQSWKTGAKALESVGGIDAVRQGSDRGPGAAVYRPLYPELVARMGW